jgi:hypothetical protein
MAVTAGYCSPVAEQLSSSPYIHAMINGSIESGLETKTGPTRRKDLARKFFSRNTFA